MKRRTLLGYSAAVCGLAVLGSSAIVYSERYSVVPNLLRELVGDFQMDPENEQRFVDALAEHYGAEKFAAMVALYEIRTRTGLGTAYTNSKIERFDRKLITDFLTSTDYLRKQHETNPEVSFIGYKLPCSNPYATFTV